MSTVRFVFHQETGDLVHWLSIELNKQGERFALCVPCPAIDLIDLICVGTDDRKQLSRHLRLNPGLLLFSLAEYWKDQGEPPQAGEQLSAWCSRHLIGALANANHDSTSDENTLCEFPDRLRVFLSSRKKQTIFFQKFLRARTQSKLRKSLNQFMRLCGASDSHGRSIWLDRILGSTMRADDLNCKQVRKNRTCAGLVDDWQSDSLMGIDVVRLIRFASDDIELQSNFDERLLEEKLAAMKQLAYGASHEINNPLANISTRAQTMLAGEKGHEKRYQLSVIYEQALRAHEMISDMMLFAHPPAMERRSVSIRLLVRKIVTELTPLLDSNSEIELTVTFGAHVDRVSVDPVQISVAIKNLIRNSIDALRSTGPSNRWIDVRINQVANSAMEISVSDNGVGISSEVGRHLFDPFYSGREAGRGLGFGLSKVWTIAKLHGGQVWWDDQAESETRFVLELPMEGTGVASPVESGGVANPQTLIFQEEAA